jgi:hypothetical protein
MERRGGSAVYFSVLAVTCFHFMLQLITILNRCHRFPGFVYQQARFSSDHQSIEIAVRPRKGSKAVCSRCHKPAPGYDQLTERRFEFIPFWGFLVFLLYSMRRVDCRRCQAVVVEEVPWGDGKRTLTKAYMLFLARWARRLSWKETAESFRTSWDKVFDAVEHVVTWGLEHRVLGQIDAIGVDEIQYARGHKYLTLVYQIDLGMTRLLWIGKERTIESFQGFFTAMGKDVISKIVFVCSDMWEPYLKLNGEESIMGRKVAGTNKHGGSAQICSRLIGHEETLEAATQNEISAKLWTHVGAKRKGLREDGRFRQVPNDHAGNATTGLVEGLDSL